MPLSWAESAPSGARASPLLRLRRAATASTDTMRVLGSLVGAGTSGAAASSADTGLKTNTTGPSVSWSPSPSACFSLTCSPLSRVPLELPSSWTK